MKKMVVPFEVKQITEDADYFMFEGYASTFGNTDLGDDVVVAGAFTQTIAELMASKKTGKLPALWQHDCDEPIGSYTELQEDARGLFVKGRLPKADTFVSGRVIPQMKAESIGSMSIGYSVLDYAIEGGIRMLKALKLWEISLVTMPMNELAEITDMKSATPYQDLPLAARDLAWSADAALSRVKPFLDSADEPSEKYRKAFLWFDSDHPDEYGSYKLPIADVIDGKLTAVPRAIFAAAAALSGARGGVNIPDADRASVIANVDRYYAKMNLDSPFTKKSGMRVDDLASLTERDLEKLFKSGVSFTNQTSKRLASALKTFLRDEDESGNREDSTGSAVVDELKSLLELAKTLTSKIEGK
jgi:HK97 family phage prohead protease